MRHFKANPVAPFGEERWLANHQGKEGLRTDFVCTGDLYVYHVHCVDACSVHVEARLGTGFSGAGFTGDDEPPGECWELNPGFLQES